MQSRFTDTVNLKNKSNANIMDTLEVAPSKSNYGNSNAKNNTSVASIFSRLTTMDFNLGSFKKGRKHGDSNSNSIDIYRTNNNNNNTNTNNNNNTTKRHQFNNFSIDIFGDPLPPPAAAAAAAATAASASTSAASAKTTSATTDTDSPSYSKHYLQNDNNNNNGDGDTHSHDDVDADADPSAKQQKKKEPEKFGTLDGVLGRCLLGMFGVILFLRMGWIVGNAGLLQSTAIVLLSALVAFVTTLSLSAITTNGQIEAGGPYFLICRSLGPKYGGVIGILFAFGNCVGVALHLLGFAEATVNLYSDNFTPGRFLLTHGGEWDIQFISEVSLLLLFLIASRGVGWIIRFNLCLLFAMILSIIVFFIGAFMPLNSAGASKVAYGFTGFSMETLSSNLHGAYLADYNFLLILAIYFPSITGCFAGANISGDLKKPERNIPVGTLWAVIIATLIYIAILWTLGATVLRSFDVHSLDAGGGGGAEVEPEYSGLLYDYMIMSHISWYQPLVDVGIFASTLSSATASIVAAPRIFAKLCTDGIIPRLRWFGVGRASDGEPIRGYIICLLFCFAFQMSGNVNFIAPLVTNFFLLTYALVNYSCFKWEMSRVPGWRPSFKYYNKWLSLGNCVLCVSLMFLIDWKVAFITVFCGIAIYKYIGYLDTGVHSAECMQELKAGTVIQSEMYSKTCRNLLQYQLMQTHAKVDRPTFLLLNTNHAADLRAMFAFVSKINYGHGLVIIGDVILGDLADPKVNMRIMNEFLLRKRYRNYQNTQIPAAIQQQAIIETCIAKTFEEGILNIFQLSGMGSFCPNVVCLKMSSHASDMKQIQRGIQRQKLQQQKLLQTQQLTQKQPTKQTGKKRHFLSKQPSKTQITPAPAAAPAAEQEQEQQQSSASASASALASASSVLVEQQQQQSDDDSNGIHIMDEHDEYKKNSSNVTTTDDTNTNANNTDTDTESNTNTNSVDDEQSADMQVISDIKNVRPPAWYSNLKNALNLGSGVIMTHFNIDLDAIVVNKDKYQHQHQIQNRADSAAESGSESESVFIDIYWFYDDGGLTVLIGYLLQLNETNPIWKHSTLRLMVLDILGVEHLKEIANLMHKLRIDAEIVSVSLPSSSAFRTTANNDAHANENENENENEKQSAENKNPSSDVNQQIKDIIESQSERNSMTMTNSNNGNAEDDAAILKAKEEKMFHLNLRESVGGLDLEDDIDDILKKLIAEQLLPFSEFARNKIAKYHEIGQMVKAYSSESELCILTLPFPRKQYEWWEYRRVIQELTAIQTPIIFVRGNQQQILTTNM